MSRIVIAGGGIIGSSIAYHLARAGVAADVTVIEPDPTYEFAATPRAVGGIRLQQGVRENVQMSLYGLEFFKNFAHTVVGGKVTFDPAFHQQGYMFTVPGRMQRDLEAMVAMQQAEGVEIEILDRAAMKARFPSFQFADADFASLSVADGQIDPYAALMGLRRAAEGLGVAYRKDRVTGIEAHGGLVRTVTLESGAALHPEILVNCANAWAPALCAMVGMAVPIYPLRRQQFYFLCQTKLEWIPAVREAAGFSVRPEREGYLVGLTRFDEPHAFNWELDHSWFEDHLWPGLAQRCAAFETVKLQRGWLGHYDFNPLDCNPIIGPYAGVVDNFFLVAGFSGHGMQHAPAVGRGVAERLLKGRYETLDLSRFAYQRVLDNAPLEDMGPKA